MKAPCVTKEAVPKVLDVAFKLEKADYAGAAEELSVSRHA